MQNRPSSSLRSLAVPDALARLKIFLADLDEPLPEGCLVTEEESFRARTFRHHQQSHRFLHSRHIVRMLLCRWNGVPPTILQFHAGAFGKPRAPGIPGEVNWSHSLNVLAIAISPDYPVGIDLEHCPSGETCRECCASALIGEEWEWCLDGETDLERRLRFARLWCLKEAVLKASGEGLSRDMREIELLPGRSAPELKQLPAGYGPVAQWQTGFPDTGDPQLVCAFAMPVSSILPDASSLLRG